MRSNNLFEAALSITEPWLIENVEFDPEKKRLDIYMNFKPGSVFKYGEPGFEDKYKAYDTVHKTWRHLNFFEHECFLHCRIPRIKIGDNKIRLISPSWEGKSKGFTLLFEALIIQMCSYMPVVVVSRMIGESDDKIWRMLNTYIEEAREQEDFSTLENLGMDETSKAKGHDYITLFANLDQRRTVFVTEGKDHTTVERFVDDLKNHNGDPKNIKNVSCDMSPAFIKGVSENLKNAKITFDKFHILKIINKGVDEVRKQEVAKEPILKKTKYIFLKNNDNLTNKQNEKLESLKISKLNLKSVRALHIRENFQAIYNAKNDDDFITLLKKWYFWATHSKLEPIIKAAKTIKSHWYGVVEWQRSRINNGILEGMNSIVQAAKARARGFRSFRNYKIIVYLTTGKLNFQVLNPHIVK